MIVSHQTARLAKGKHESPDRGVCVMELASMLAGERFTDRPTSVCPVIAGFLRAYNDTVDDHRRQDLYRYAALAVGTRAGERVRAQRAALCLRWVRALQDRHPRTLLARLRTAPLPPSPLATEIAAPGEVTGRAAAWMAKHDPDAHDATLAFLDRLLDPGETEPVRVREPASLDRLRA